MSSAHVPGRRRECRRRQILEHLGDPQACGRGRCCGGCHPDPELERGFGRRSRPARAVGRPWGFPARGRVTDHAPAERRGADRGPWDRPAFCEKHGESLSGTLSEIGIPRASG